MKLDMMLFAANDLTISTIRYSECSSVGSLLLGDEFLVSKETVVLRRWERSKQKFGFIKRVDKG